MERGTVPYKLGVLTQSSNCRTNQQPRFGGFVSGFYQKYCWEIDNGLGFEHGASAKFEAKCSKSHRYFCFLTKFDFILFCVCVGAVGRDLFERPWYLKELYHYPKSKSSTTRRGPRSNHSQTRVSVLSKMY